MARAIGFATQNPSRDKPGALAQIDQEKVIADSLTAVRSEIAQHAPVPLSM
jgi:hypothetical protein